MNTVSGKTLAASCRHCHTSVIRDPRGRWVHTSLSYVCRDRWGTIVSTYADAAPPRGVAPVGPPAPRPRPVGGPKR